MIKVTVEVKERATSRRVRITAPSIEQALTLAGYGKPGKEVRVVFPLDADFFAGSAAPTAVAPVPASNPEAA